MKTGVLIKTVNFCNKFNKNSKVFQKNADINTVGNIQHRKGLDMRIENEMLSRFNKKEVNMAESTLSSELDFFFENVMDTVVDFFVEKEPMKA